MSGNSWTAPWKTFRAEETLDLLGLLTADPRRALADIVDRPRVYSGGVVLALALLGRALTSAPAADLGSWTGGVLGRVLSGVGAWMAFAGVLHLACRAIGKHGRFLSLLALTGWLGLLLWAEVPFRFAPSVSGWVILARLVIRVTLLAVFGWGLRRIYGLSPVAAFGLVVIPTALLGAAIAIAGLVLALAAAGNAAIFQSFFH